MITIDNSGEFAIKAKEWGIERPDEIHYDQIPVLNLPGIILVNDCKEIVKDFIQTDKKDGVKKAHYFWQRELNAVSALDTEEQLRQSIHIMNQQKFTFSKDIEVSSEVCKFNGIKRAIIHVFANEDKNVQMYGYNGVKTVADNVSIAMGYSPAGYEECLTEVFM